MIRGLCIALVLACLPGCYKHTAVQLNKSAHALQQQHRPLIVGKWYGESPTTDGGHVQEIADNRANGTFVVNFRVIDKAGKITYSQEGGYWGTAGNVYFTITRGWIENGKFQPAVPGNPSLEDAYQIQSLDAGKFRYKSLEGGNVYSAVKVDAAFQFPAL